MPRTVIKPIPKVVESIGDQVLRCSEVKPWIDYFMSAFVTQVYGVVSCQNWETTHIRGLCFRILNREES
jgi:hypothetical protein